MTRLSVVIPTRNSATYLRPLLCSLLRSNEQPFEYIFIDGESTDGTVQLINGFSPGVDVQLYSSTPRGVYDAWNMGCSRAKGEWIWVVCSDDLMYEDSIANAKTQIAKASSAVGFVAWNIDIIREDGSVASNTRDSSPLNYLDGQLTRVTNTRSGRFEALALYLFRAHFLSFMAHAFRRKVWEEMMFPTDLGPSADIDWTLHAGLRGWSRFTVPQTLAAWRVHGGAATSNAKHHQRILAHAKLRAEVRLKLAALVRVTDSAFEFEPAHDFYAWLSVYRQERGLVRIRAFLHALRSAGPLGLLELTAGKLTNTNSLSAYRRPSRQFLRLLDKQEGDVIFE